MNQKRWLGLILILLGSLIVLGNLGIVDMNVWSAIFTYWPLLLVGAGLYNLFTNPAGRVGGVIVLVIGSLFLANNLDQVEIFEYISFWPVVLILVGLWLLFRGGKGPKDVEKDSLNLINIFSGTNSRVISSNFKGGSSISIFGGAEIDLREAQLSGGKAKFDMFALFGGSDIYVPDNWDIVIKGIPIFGGWDDNTGNLKGEAEETVGTLVINCLVLFGGIDVNNKK